MEDLIKKITQYQLFNFLLSGALFTTLVNITGTMKIDNEDGLTAFFLYYFLGLIISRIGSLLVEPVLKQFKIIRFAAYDDYLSAVKKDSKLDTLSQENNTYRTLIATFIVFIVYYLVSEHYSDNIKHHLFTAIVTGCVSLLILFVFAYRKQTSHITKRVMAANNKK